MEYKLNPTEEKTLAWILDEQQKSAGAANAAAEEQHNSRVASMSDDERAKAKPFDAVAYAPTTVEELFNDLVRNMLLTFERGRKDADKQRRIKAIQDEE